MSAVNDTDNDLLPDTFEPASDQDRYDDPDGDGASNLDELLAGTTPDLADNDSDADGLPDDWERRYFATLTYAASSDPDADSLSNAAELSAGL